MPNESEREERTFKIGELRVEGDGKKPQITGYAAVFDKPSSDLGGFTEFVKPGCFRKTIQESDIKGLINHDPNLILGRNKAGTMSLAEDNVGLKFSIDPPDTSYARDLVASIKRGDIDQCSFGFRTIKDSWRTVDGKQCRDLEEAQLFDVSVVTNPAYPQTSASVRAKLESLNNSDEPDETVHSEGEPANNRHSAEDDLRVIQLKRVIENIDMEVK